MVVAWSDLTLVGSGSPSDNAHRTTRMEVHLSHGLVRVEVSVEVPASAVISNEDIQPVRRALPDPRAYSPRTHAGPPSRPHITALLGGLDPRICLVTKL